MGRLEGATEGRAHRARAASVENADEFVHAARAIALLTPGFVHKMRNSLMLFSTHAQLLAMGEQLVARAARGHQALRDEVDFAKRMLDLLAATGGESADSGLDCLGTLVRVLASFYTWEGDARSIPLEADAHAQLRMRASARAWIIAATLGVDALARHAAQPGFIRLTARADPERDAGTLGIEFCAAGGGLPFPPRALRLDARVVQACARAGLVLEARAAQLHVREGVS